MITLQNWLADRKRKYADGLALFQALAPEEMRKKYIAFFSEVKEVPQFDSHFTVLVNKLTTVARLSSAQPQITISERGSILLKTAVAATKAIEKTANQLKGDKVLKEILVKESELFKLQDKITELEEDNDDKSGEIDQLQAELEEAQEELQELQDQFALLRPGAKIATYSSLPDNIRTIFDEVRQITPLYAALFTEMQNEALTPEQRKPIADQAHELWTRRAKLWDQIDAWAEGKQIQLKTEVQKTEELPADQLLKGMQIANRIERLRENIRRTETSIAQHEKNGKLNLRQKAEQRLAYYKRELAELDNLK
jgi:chromosome segregation ATPase